MDKRDGTDLKPLEYLRRLCQQFSGARAASLPAKAPASAGIILIIEVGDWTCGLLPRRLEQAGYATQIVRGGKAAMDILEHEPPILFIVGGSADLDLYRALHRASPAPIFALVPQEDEGHALVAFAAGVDQYQTNHIGSMEVVARARALLRRRA